MLARKKTYIQNCTGPHLRRGEREAKRKVKSGIISKIVFGFLLLAFIGVTVYVLFFSTYLKISQINISGNVELNADEIKNVVESKQQGKLFKTIPKDNFLLISAKDIENSLAGQFKKIKQVSVMKKFPDTINVSLQERTALLILCEGEKCFLIDEVGNAYNEADFSSPELTQNHLIKIVDKGLSRVKVGDNILDQPYVQYVSSLKEQLQSLGLSIEGEYWTPALAADEINVKVTGGEELYFSTLFPLKSAIETLNIVLKKELSGNQPSEITYIDLRTENKVFYKLNAAAPPVENVDNQNTDKNKK